MKRYVVPNISDIIGRIKYLVYESSDAEQIYCSEDDEQSKADFYMGLPNDVFKAYDRDKLQQETDIRVLDRMVALCKDKLSPEQLDIIYTEYRKKYKITKSDVKIILDKIKGCHRIFSGDPPYRKVTDFKYDHHLSDKDLLDIVHSLTVDDYIYNTRSTTYAFLGEVYMAFRKYNVSLPDGVTNIIVYAKLNIDRTTNDVVVVFSIHEEGDWFEITFNINRVI